MYPKIPLEPGKYYHIYNRGNNRCKLFYEERNYDFFLRLYEKYIYRVADTYAWVLMGNHFHFLVKIKTENVINGKSLDPSRQFAHLFNSYAQSINKAVGRTGALFEHNFRRKEVTTEEYLRQLIIYIHRNPKKHKFSDFFMDYPWSSFNSILTKEKTKLQSMAVIELYGGIHNFIKAHDDNDEKDDVNWGIE